MYGLFTYMKGEQWPHSRENGLVNNPYMQASGYVLKASHQLPGDSIVTFSTHTWRSLSHWKGHKSPSQKGHQQNCQVKGVCIFWHLFCIFNSQLGVITLKTLVVWKNSTKIEVVGLKTPVSLAVFSCFFPASEPKKTKKHFPKGGFFLGLFASGWSSWGGSWNGIASWNLVPPVFQKKLLELKQQISTQRKWPKNTKQDLLFHV